MATHKNHCYSHRNEQSIPYVGAFRCLLDHLKPHFDFIIVDLSPSPSPVNQVMAMSCDYILPPCFLDLYSCGSIYGLLRNKLPEWYIWHRETVKMQAKNKDEDDKPFLLQKDPPQILPIICTSFDVQQDPKKTEGNPKSQGPQKTEGAQPPWKP